LHVAALHDDAKGTRIYFRPGEAWQVTLHDDLLRDLRGLLQAENVKAVYG